MGKANYIISGQQHHLQPPTHVNIVPRVLCLHTKRGVRHNDASSSSSLCTQRAPSVSTIHPEYRVYTYTRRLVWPRPREARHLTIGTHSTGKKAAYYIAEEKLKRENKLKLCRSHAPRIVNNFFLFIALAPPRWPWIEANWLADYSINSLITDIPAAACLSLCLISFDAQSRKQDNLF